MNSLIQQSEQLNKVKIR